MVENTSPICNDDDEERVEIELIQDFFLTQADSRNARHHEFPFGLIITGGLDLES